jgi:hypothetical protein
MLLDRAAVAAALSPWIPADDYFRNGRGAQPSVGAIGGPSPAVRFGIKS